MHGQLVDETNVIIEAKREYTKAIFDVFRLMGEAFGLHIKYNGIKEIIIPPIRYPRT